MVIFEEQLSKPTTTTMSSNNNQDDDNQTQISNDTTTIITNVKLKQQQQHQSVFNHHLNGFHSKNDDEELNEDQLQTNICSNQTVMNHNNNNNNIDSNSNKTEQHIDTIDNHQQENDQDDDDFADFATFMPDSNQKNDDDDNFDEDFDDFADFTTTTANVPEPIVTDDDKNIKTLKNSRQLIEDTFPIKTSSIYDDERLSIDFFDKKFCDPNAQQLWNNLQQLDLKLNFHFNKWKQSSSFKHLIESLKIDSRNVIPPDIFPSTTNITLNQILQPTAYDYSTTTTTATKIDANDDECNGLTMADVFCKTNVNKNHLTTKIESSTTTAESLEWPADHSMTTLPSTTTTNQSMLCNNLAQDLDFFETKYVSNNNNISNVKNEDHHHHNLIAEFDEFLRIDTESAIVNNNEISTKSTTNKTINRMNEQVLSAEALQILNELPTLSMMRSKILSYPMLNNRQCRSNSNSPSSSSHHHHS